MFLLLFALAAGTVRVGEAIFLFFGTIVVFVDAPVVVGDSGDVVEVAAVVVFVVVAFTSGVGEAGLVVVLFTTELSFTGFALFAFSLVLLVSTPDSEIGVMVEIFPKPLFPALPFPEAKNAGVSTFVLIVYSKLTLLVNTLTIVCFNNICT